MAENVYGRSDPSDTSRSVHLPDEGKKERQKKKYDRELFFYLK